MRELTLVFIISSFCLLALSRCLLSAWQWRRVKQAGGLLPVLRGGLRIDAHQIAIFAGIPALLAPWLGHFHAAVLVTAIWFQVCWFFLVLLEASTPQFIQEYDTRPNRLYVEYLKHPQEVFGMLWKGYKAVILAALIVLAAFVWLGYELFAFIPPDQPMAWWARPIFSLVAAAVIFLAVRGTLGHRPINPSTVAWCGDSMVNTLPLNSLYNVFYAIYSMKNERSAQDVYGHMPESDINDIVARCAGIADTAGADPDIPTLHTQIPAIQRARPLNIVMILEESLGAQYVGHLGGAGLTPELDRIAKSAWTFTRTFASGTRSVRGLEAVVAGFPPTISDAVLRLPDSQSHFFTMAQVLKQHGYRSRFIYGGEAHFDNMKSFFLGNGFDELYDLPTFTNPEFVGTWGASDEDMFNRLDTLLRSDGDQPTFTLAFSVTNHSPWEYPAGRIEPVGSPASVENTVRYADWAIGRFFDKARQAAYWDNTVFLIVADHDSRVFGANLVPLRHFHIPALIFGADVQARQDDRLVSQIDLAPTLLSLAGLQTRHPMIGHDLNGAAGNRAMMQYGENYGYLKEDALVVLEPHKEPTQYTWAAPDDYTAVAADPDLVREARAHVLWPSWAYKNHAYTLPSLKAGGKTRETHP
jgi:phosphoglycerol transferase MdoB-like AlkP superfamily enzyme